MDELVSLTGNSKCRFCQLSKNDHLMYGPLYKLKDFVAHYYCVLLSNRMKQLGTDEEGMLGFLLCDIKAELKRSANIKCIYCRRPYASIECSVPKCNKTFHLPCGIKAGSLHQFMNQFKSFCHIHRPFQEIPKDVLKEAQTVRPTCCICCEPVNVTNRKSTLWAPCCTKTWYHRKCCQKLAHSAGYFFKCAICNDTKKFKNCMQKFGIFIPQQDASWELVPNAYQDLLFVYSNCDAEVCKCPGGRKQSIEDTMWEIIVCQTCGSQGIHIACGKLKFIEPEWECKLCEKITKRNSATSNVRKKGKDFLKPSREISETGRKRRSTEDLENSILDKRKKTKSDLEEEEGCRMKTYLKEEAECHCKASVVEERGSRFKLSFEEDQNCKFRVSLYEDRKHKLSSLEEEKEEKEDCTLIRSHKKEEWDIRVSVTGEESEFKLSLGGDEYKFKGSIIEKEEEEEDVVVDVEAMDDESQIKEEIHEDNSFGSEESNDSRGKKLSQKYNIQEVLSTLKPAPLSHKLAMIEKLKKASGLRLKPEFYEAAEMLSSSERESDVIMLSDSEEDEIQVIWAADDRLNLSNHFRVKKKHMAHGLSYEVRENEEEILKVETSPTIKTSHQSSIKEPPTSLHNSKKNELKIEKNVIKSDNIEIILQ